MPSVFCFFRRTPQRLAVIAENCDIPQKSYLLYGADRFHEHGWQMDCNLLRPPSSQVHILGDMISRQMHYFKGYGGDFATVFANLKYANRADVVLSTVDTVGIPLALLRYMGLLRRPLVYVSIGLVERFDNMEPSFLKKLQMRSFCSCSSMIGYGYKEVQQLRERFGERQQYHFIPFGVDAEGLKPNRSHKSEQVDVISAGMDTHRDFKQLKVFARRNPSRKIKIITSREQWQELGTMPPNVIYSEPLPFADFLQELVSARIVALPVKENGYSGATTLLLQAMALGKPVVVTKTGAIEGGYGFVDKELLIFSKPNSPSILAEKLEEALASLEEANTIGRAGQVFVTRNHSWDQYVESIQDILGASYYRGG